MSSWLPRSLADTLRLDDDNNYEENNIIEPHHHNDSVIVNSEFDLDDNKDVVDSSDGRGVKEDLSELKQTLTRQLWGVASFIAPPPPPPPPPSTAAVLREELDLKGVDRSGSSGESETEYVGEEGEYSNYEEEEEEEEEEREYSNYEEEEEDSVLDAVGVTDEVLAFARNIAHHPETWLDFPIEEDDFDHDFEISEAQQKHAYAVERLAPRLAALRIELCPVHMSAGFFWMVYFVLLHTRLNKHDAELLSTPQLVEARAMWMKELQKKTKPDSEFFSMNAHLMKDSSYSPREDFDSTSSEDAHCRYFMPQRGCAFEPITYHTGPDIEAEKLEHGSADIEFIDKVVIKENPPSKILEKELVAGPSKQPFLDYDEHEDDWVQDIEESEGYSATRVLMENEEEISFSDLEDDIDCTMPVKSNLF